MIKICEFQEYDFKIVCCHWKLHYFDQICKIVIWCLVEDCICISKELYI